MMGVGVGGQVRGEEACIDHPTYTARDNDKCNVKVSIASVSVGEQTRLLHILSYKGVHSIRQESSAMARVSSAPGCPPRDMSANKRQRR